MTRGRLLVSVACAALGIIAAATALPAATRSRKDTAAPLPVGTDGGEWRVYGGDHAGSRYSPLTQIDALTFPKLKVAWRWDSPDNAICRERSDLRPGPHEGTPLM